MPETRETESRISRVWQMLYRNQRLYGKDEEGDLPDRPEAGKRQKGQGESRREEPCCKLEAKRPEIRRIRDPDRQGRAFQEEREQADRYLRQAKDRLYHHEPGTGENVLYPRPGLQEG